MLGYGVLKCAGSLAKMLNCLCASPPPLSLTIANNCKLMAQENLKLFELIYGRLMYLN